MDVFGARVAASLAQAELKLTVHAYLPAYADQQAHARRGWPVGAGCGPPRPSSLSPPTGVVPGTGCRPAGPLHLTRDRISFIYAQLARRISWRLPATGKSKRGWRDARAAVRRPLSVCATAGVQRRPLTALDPPLGSRSDAAGPTGRRSLLCTNADSRILIAATGGMPGANLAPWCSDDRLRRLSSPAIDCRLLRYLGLGRRGA